MTHFFKTCRNERNVLLTLVIIGLFFTAYSAIVAISRNGLKMVTKLMTKTFLKNTKTFYLFPYGCCTNDFNLADIDALDK